LREAQLKGFKAESAVYQDLHHSQVVVIVGYSSGFRNIKAALNFSQYESAGINKAQIIKLHSCDSGYKKLLLQLQSK